MKATGNKPIRLLIWKKYLLELFKFDENPTFKKVPDAVLVELKPTTPNSDLPLEIEDDISELPLNEKYKGSKPVIKKRKLQSETDEMVNLTTSDLQRLLLLEQIKLTQIQSEKLMLTNESKENEASSSSVMGGQAVFEIEEKGS